MAEITKDKYNNDVDRETRGSFQDNFHQFEWIVF